MNVKEDDSKIVYQNYKYLNETSTFLCTTKKNEAISQDIAISHKIYKCKTPR